VTAGLRGGRACSGCLLQLPVGRSASCLPGLDVRFVWLPAQARPFGTEGLPRHLQRTPRARTSAPARAPDHTPQAGVSVPRETKAICCKSRAGGPGRRARVCAECTGGGPGVGTVSAWPWAPAPSFTSQLCPLESPHSPRLKCSVGLHGVGWLPGSRQLTCCPVVRKCLSLSLMNSSAVCGTLALTDSASQVGSTYVGLWRWMTGLGHLRTLASHPKHSDFVPSGRSIVSCSLVCPERPPGSTLLCGAALT